MREAAIIRLRNHSVSVSETVDGTLTITGKCVMSGDPVVIRGGDHAGFVKWIKDDVYIQDALPTLDIASREFLISGMKSDMFDELFY